MPKERSGRRRRKNQREKGARKGKDAEVIPPLIELNQLDKASVNESKPDSPKQSPLKSHGNGKGTLGSPHLVLGRQVRMCDLNSSRPSPLPVFSWADSKEIWDVMVRNDEKHIRNPDIFQRNPTLHPKGRTVLLSLLMEICEKLELQRETFYLCVDYIDRYIGLSENITTDQLERIGMTALFIAAKVEEIYPPSLAKIVHMADDTLTESQILEQERDMLKKLNWDMCPMTSISWLQLFLEITNTRLRQNPDFPEQDFVVPKYSSYAFAQIARLIDLSILDAGCLKFSHSMIAAASLFHLTSQEIALSVSGFKWQDISACVNWMVPFSATIQEMRPAGVKHFQGVATEDSHMIQIDEFDLSMLVEPDNRQDLSTTK